MASIDIAPEVSRSYQKIVTGPVADKPSPTYAQWALFSVSAPLQNAFVQTNKASTLKVQTSGEGELEELIEEFNDGRVQFAFVKVKDPNTGLPKFVLICWCGEGVPERVKGYFTGHLDAVTKVLHGYHVQITARSEAHLKPEDILQKVADASGAKYSVATSAAAPAPAPKPPVATKPVFGPTRTMGGAVPLPIGGRPPVVPKRDTNVDADGWGDDAPPVTRSQLEKVPSAYKPTKVDINELKAQPTSTTSGQGTRQQEDEDREVVKGGYQPIGKIDIAALRKGYKEERPEPVKGAWQPVDVSSIRKAAPAPAPVRQEEEEEEHPKPVAERMSAFNQPKPQAERLTSLPKPTVAKKFGTGAPSFGTKPITPSEYGFAPKTSSGPAVGAINKSGITKSPAQLWAEKKARERGMSGASETTPPVGSPAAHMSPSMTGASASSQQAQEEEKPRPVSISALKNKFAGGAPPMGAPAPASPQRTGGFSPAPPGAFSPAHTGGSSAPPPPPLASRPSAPPREEEPPKPRSPSPEPQREIEPVHIPEPPAQPPRSPTPPTPEAPSSPVRLVRPVAREDSPEPEDLVTKPDNPPVAIPTESLAAVVPKENELEREEEIAPPATAAAGSTGGLRAHVLYDYTKDEDNEIDLVEGQVVTDIETIDENWWSGRNAAGQIGLFPSNYVELIEGDAEPAPPAPAAAREPSPEPRAPSPTPAAAAAPAQGSGKRAIALYDYTAAEDNEISFPEDAIIENIQFPDDEWWQGTYKGQEGLFPANYVELQP